MSKKIQPGKTHTYIIKVYGLTPLYKKQSQNSLSEENVSVVVPVFGHPTLTQEYLGG